MTAHDDWRAEYDKAPKRDVDFETMSGVPLEPVYGPDDAERPGVWPYTRGPYASMYRSKLWTMRMFAGFGTAEDTNTRFKELLRSGGDGLSTAFDLPTLMGRDSDDPRCVGEVGRAGVAVDSLADVEDLFAGIDVGNVTTSMTINSAAPLLLAMYVANRFAYVEAAIAAGLDVDDFARRLSFFFNAHIDFFEEIAKLRAARRIWARWLRDRYGAKRPRSMQLRFHTQTAGVSLTAQQPEVNIARVAIEALAGVLAGTQSLHTDSFDEALALPTEKAARVALRTQQVIAHETGAATVADPLGGSWFVEELTDEMERQAEAIFAHVQSLGDGSMLEGTYVGIEQGWFQDEIAESAYQFERKVVSGRRILVGANAFTEGDDDRPAILSIDPVVEDVQLKRLAEVKRGRDEGAVATALNRVRKEAAETDTNLMPAFIDAVGVYATIGELTSALADVFGRWTETPSI